MYMDLYILYCDLQLYIIVQLYIVRHFELPILTLRAKQHFYIRFVPTYYQEYITYVLLILYC